MANLFAEPVAYEQFDPNTDKIALVLKEFTLLKNADGLFQRYNEPYIISLAIDENGANNPAIDFNILPYPKVRKGDTIQFGGQGHLLYGPNNPGEFLAYSILFMESDQDIRDLGKTIERILESQVVDLGAKALLQANPTFGTALSILTSLTALISSEMQQNKDDELYRRNGTLLRDIPPPYNIDSTFNGRNDFIESKVRVLPLSGTLNLERSGKRMAM